MSEKLYLYPVWTRLWHWGNALFFLLLIVTGLSMQYSSVEFPIVRFDLAVSLHNISGILVLVWYLVFITANRFTSNGKYYKIKRNGFISELTKQIVYYTFGIFRKETPPFPITLERKFNPLQKVSYVIAMYYLMPLMIVSGVLLLFPEVIPSVIFGTSGIHIVVLIHVIAGFILSIFLVVHVYFCTIGATLTSNFKSMFTGYHSSH